MKSHDLRSELVILLSFTASLIFINVLGLDHFVRVDLTQDQVFTLSEASQKTMQDLEDQVTITAYFSSGLPAQFETNRRYLKDLLEEYRAAAGGRLSFEFIDPEAQETDADKETKKEVKQDIFGRRIREQTSVEKELERLGVTPVEMRVIEEDEARTKRGYMGLVIRYQEETEVIPVVQDTTTVEYDITSMVRRLTRIKVPVLGILQGKGEKSLEEDLQRLQPLFAQNYEVKPVTLTAENPEIPDDIDALLVLGTKQPYGDAEKKAVDAFLMQGKSAAFFLDLMNVDLKSFSPSPNNHGWGQLIGAYGIEMGSELVADVEASTLSISERRGRMVVRMPVRYPFIPQLKFLDPEHVVTRGIQDVPLAFVAPLFLNEEFDGVEVKSLAKSSEKSWLEPAEPTKMDPRRKWGEEDITFTGPYDLLASAQGQLPSAFPSEGAAKAEEQARVFVAGTSAIADPNFLSPSTASLMLNVTDWMLLDPAMLEMRTRGMAEAPLDPEMSDDTKKAIKWGLSIVPLLMLNLAGLLLRARRNARRRQLLAKAGA